MTPAQAAVLADHLRSILPEQDAVDVVRWAENVREVRSLINWNVKSFTNSGEARACPACDESMMAGVLHAPTCSIARSLRRVIPNFSEMEIEDAHATALEMEASRRWIAELTTVEMWILRAGAAAFADAATEEDRPHSSGSNSASSST